MRSFCFWLVQCKVNILLQGQLKWEPAPDDIMQLYEMVNQVGVIELEWQCPGRRAPSPVSTDYYEEEEDDEEK